MANQFDNPVFNHNILEMLTVANEYCLFIEKAHEYSKDDIVNYMYKVLPLIYLKGQLMPEIEVENDKANEKYVTQENWEILFNDLKSKLLKDDSFWYINENEFIDTEISQGSIAECLSDIYQDLKDFIILYQKNSIHAKQNATFNCKELFKRDWGYKTLIVQKALHHITYGDMDLPEEDNI